jgi:radical SAM superfamily enzyme YgiQ (UPF0313 family)
MQPDKARRIHCISFNRYSRSKYKRIKDSIHFVNDLGAKISLSEYTPIPHTKNWENINNTYTEEPLCQNNTYFISQSKEYDKILDIKKLAKI